MKIESKNNAGSEAKKMSNKIQERLGELEEKMAELIKFAKSGWAINDDIDRNIKFINQIKNTIEKTEITSSIMNELMHEISKMDTDISVTIDSINDDIKEWIETVEVIEKEISELNQLGMTKDGIKGLNDRIEKIEKKEVELIKEAETEIKKVEEIKKYIDLIEKRIAESKRLGVKDDGGKDWLNNINKAKIIIKGAIERIDGIEKEAAIREEKSKEKNEKSITISKKEDISKANNQRNKPSISELVDEMQQKVKELEQFVVKSGGWMANDANLRRKEINEIIDEIKEKEMPEIKMKELIYKMNKVKKGIDEDIEFMNSRGMENFMREIKTIEGRIWELNQSGMADDKVKNLMEKIDNIEKNGGGKLAEEAKRMKKTIQDNKASLNSIIEKISELKSSSVRDDNNWWWHTITNISNMKTAIENITDRIKSMEEEIKEKKRMNDAENEYEWLLEMQHENKESANKLNSFYNLSKDESTAAQSNSGYVDSFLALLQSVLSAIKSVLSKIIRGNERER